jgi:hypothetical protein
MMTVHETIQEIGGGKTRMSIESEFPTIEAVEQHAAMAMEGLTQPSARSTRSSPRNAIRLVDKPTRKEP